MDHKSYRLGKIKKKILVLLQAGVAFGLANSVSKQKLILKQIPKELEKIDQQVLNNAISSLYKSHLLNIKHHKDGSTTLVLAGEGKHYALRFNLYDMRVPRRGRWDKKWRIIMFDVPENQRVLRDSLRMHLREMEFMELQKSIFVHPFPCEKEVEFLVEFYNARRYVRYIVAEKIDNEIDLMKKFGLL